MAGISALTSSSSSAPLEAYRAYVADRAAAAADAVAASAPAGAPAAPALAAAQHYAGDNIYALSASGATTTAAAALVAAPLAVLLARSTGSITPVGEVLGTRFDRIA